ncbi:glycosyl hydrolase family 71-domain-containing protein [Aspergillus avenaceus]|uniref:Glycosyl hydrolase family 71-domain-containing protein n=1 Tax=Aspergillus avenaceus TaxID=36643 RepID=A0A5N6TE48_ASPAV|nr:glycosyl hydrolase family 71-domain-containing protein [Aspergillus avenaceus]
MLGLLVKAALVGLTLASHPRHRHIHRRHGSSHAHSAYTDLDVSRHWLNTSTALNETESPSFPDERLFSIAPLQRIQEEKGAFAHFMVENAHDWSVSDWENDMKLAKEAHIDAFALNFAASLTDLYPLASAFQAAESTGFKLFLSFDYAGAGPFEKSIVIGFILLYGDLPPYYKFRGKPFVSTFEGPGNAEDWKEIKKETGCFFVPSWSSLGAKDALELGTADGLFSWAGWPWGNKDMDTYVDASYLDYLDQADGKPYMMPVSPWFYTNLPGYDKNWLWRGDTLWTDRWEQVMVVQPKWLQIISWNDYGESHYIGPLRDIDNYGAFKVGKAPFNYAHGMPHDGWRLFLPYWIDTYKNGKGTITKEGVIGWYRPNPVAACKNGGTTGNTANQLQLEFEPAQVVQDKIFFSALLTASATVTVTVGGIAIPATWEFIPDGEVGVYHGSVGYGSFLGDVKISISRSGATIAEFSGPAITTSCKDGYSNFNAWVGSASGPSISAVSPKLPIEKQTCIQGTAPGNFQGICEFTCKYGYCPIGACQCTKMGSPRVKPKPTGNEGYPIAGEGSSYIGLCAFACNYGYCPPDACGTTKVPLKEPTVSPFLPSACTAGTGEGNSKGYCTATGALIRPPPANTTFTADYIGGDGSDSGLCKFACQRGYCPDACASTEGVITSCTDDDDRPECAEELPCDYSLTFNSLEALKKASADIPSGCMPMYAAQVLMDTLDAALANYTDVDNGYDDKFGYYVKYLRDMVPTAISRFLSLNKGEGPGNKYFQCRWATPGKDREYQSCPIFSPSEQQHIEYKLIDEEGFFKELQSKYGISKDWVEFGTYNRKVPPCPPWTGVGPPPTCTNPHYTYDNFPMAKTDFTIPNPKDSIKGALPRFRQLKLDLAATWGDLSFFLWDGDDDDAVAALSMPVFMLLQAVDSMVTVKQIGKGEEEAEKEAKHDLILIILSAVLLILPFAAEVVGAVTGIAWIADAAAIVDISGSMALAGYDIVKDPKSAPMELLNILFAGSGRTAKNFSKAADVRRGIKVGNLAKMGSVFRDHDSALQSLIRFCKK